MYAAVHPGWGTEVRWVLGKNPALPQKKGRSRHWGEKGIPQNVSQEHMSHAGADPDPQGEQKVRTERDARLWRGLRWPLSGSPRDVT